MFSVRDYSPEIMDDTSIEDERLDHALSELRVINRYLGGDSASKAGLKKLIPDHSENLSILDAGSGGSVISNPAGLKNQMKIYALDKNKGVCRYIKRNGIIETSVCADVKFLPFKDKSFDIIHASLFLHHFTELELKHILRSFISLTCRGVVINDLRRSILAYLGIKILTSLFSRSEMVKNDGPLSVKKGFSYKELRDLMAAINVSGYTLKRKWAFRWLLIIYIK